jgi:hypothetical protein
VKALLLHNYGRGMFWEYGPGAELHEAFTFDLDDLDQGADREHVCALVWVLANMDLPDVKTRYPSLDDGQVQDYRAKGNRSLSSGDVVVLLGLDDEPVGCFAAAPIGWTELEGVPSYIPTTDPEWSASHVAHRELASGFMRSLGSGQRNPRSF